MCGAVSGDLTTPIRKGSNCSTRPPFNVRAAGGHKRE